MWLIIEQYNWHVWKENLIHTKRQMRFSMCENERVETWFYATD